MPYVCIQHGLVARQADSHCVQFSTALGKSAADCGFIFTTQTKSIGPIVCLLMFIVIMMFFAM